jgi:hypothetical protein
LEILKLKLLESNIEKYHLLPSLKELELNIHELNCIDLQFAANLKNVTVLHITASLPIENVFALAELKQLSKLTIHARVKGISFLEDLKNLEFFELKNVFSVEMKIPPFFSCQPRKLK